MKKNKKLIYLIIAISFIAITAIGATYAYFLASGYGNKTSTVSVTADALDEVSCTATDLSMTVTGSDMKQGSSSSSGTLAKSNNGTITCTSTKHTTGTTKCTMDIVYTPTNTFTKSSNNTSNKKELTLSGSGVSTSGTISIPMLYETDMRTLTSATTIIDDLEWVFDSSDTLTYTMTSKFYNYDFNQNDLAGKTYSGTISATNITCTGASPVTNTVTFNANGGSVSQNTKQVSTGYTYGNLPTPTKSGSSFLGWSELPTGYIPVEYIESSGTQYIDTGYYWQHENIGIEFDGNVLSNPSYQSLFGNEENITSSGDTRNFAGIPHGINGEYAIYLGSGAKSGIAPKTNIRFKLDIKTTTDKNVKIFFNGIQKLNTTYSGSVMSHDTAYLTSSSSTTVGNIFLFANHNSYRGASNAATQNISAMRVYAFRLYDAGTMVRNFVPAKRTSDSKYGMYDTVNNTFYPSASGNFTGGSNKYVTKNDLVNQTGNHNLIALWQ